MKKFTLPIYRTAILYAVSMVFLLSSAISYGQQAWTLLPETNAGIFSSIYAVNDGQALQGGQSPLYKVGRLGLASKSNDAGVSWIAQNSSASVDLNDVHFEDQFNGWAVGNGVILRTTNGGTSWTATNIPGINFTSIHQYATGQTLWAAGSGGAIYRSNNQGVSWTAVTSNTTANLSDILAYTTSTIIAVGANGTISRSTDGGVTWTSTTVGSTSLNAIAGFLNSAVIVVGNSGTILRSATAGQSWSTITTAGTTVALLDVQFADNIFVACGNAGTILRSTNTGTGWTIIPTGNNEVLRKITSRLEPSNIRFWIGGERGILTSSFQATACVTPQVALTSPATVTSCVGGSVTLEANHSGTVGRRVWKKNGVNLFTTTVHPSKITLSNLQVTGAGIYTMEVSGPCGTVTTNPITVNVNATPQPSAVIGSGSPLQNVATTYSVSPIPGATYNWTAGGGGIVTGTGNEVQIAWSTIGLKTISVTATDDCGTSAVRNATVNVLSCIAPAQPSVITRTLGSECTSASAMYSVTAEQGVTYTWSLSAGGTITSSGNSATVVWNATTGSRTITVTPSNLCGNGTARTLSVMVGSSPAQPSAITGSTSVCTGASTAYSVTNVTGTTYTWDTGGAGTISGSGNAITVTWNSAGAKTLTVTPSNACGAGLVRTLSVSVTSTPSQSSVITGATAVQTGSSSQYSITQESGVTYAWNGGIGATVTGSGNLVSISWSSAGSKTITVTPSNGCGAGAARTLTVNVSDCVIPAQPSTVSGSTTACVGIGSIYSVTATGGVSYNWDPGLDGAVVGSGNSVTLTWSTNGSKIITVTPFNACGNGPTRTFNVTVSGAPMQPSVITGSTAACKDATTAYSVTNVPGVTYTWETGGKGTVSGSGSSVNITWTNTGTNTLVVTPSTSCGTGISRTLTVVVNRVPDPVSEITGSFSGCVNTAIPFSVTNVSGVTYTWNGGANSTPSSATNSPTVTWTTAGSKTLTVTPSNSCGNGLSASRTITITPLPSAAGAITGSTAATEGVAQTYSVANVAGTTYTWSGGSGATIIGVGNSVQISWSSIGSKTVSVTPSNACGSATANTLGVTVGSAPCAPLGAPANVTGSTSFITGSTAAFTAALVSGAVSYTFTVSPSTGTSIVNTANSNEKNITFANAGTYVIAAAAVNACGGTSPPVTITVQVCDSPVVPPTGLVSQGAACIGKKQRYSVNVVPGFTYQWFATNGVVTNVSNGVADITWNNTSTGQVSVRSVNPCGAASALVFGTSETLIGNPSEVTITNNLVGAFCDGKVVTWTISNPQAGVTYEWVSDRAATPTATAITATINGPINIQLYGNNACATNFALSGITGNPFPVPTTAPGVISGTLTPTVGQIVDYTIPNEGSPFGVRWNFGSGASDLPVGTTSMQALFGTPGAKTLTAQYVSNPSCNVAGPARTLEVVAVNPCTVPSAPTAVTRLHGGDICKDVAYAFSVPNIAGVTYNWNAGPDAVITGSGNEVLIKWSTVGTKNITASYTNACGTSALQQTSINIAVPPTALSITGNSTACQLATTNYLVSNISGITYTWEAPGATITGQGTNNISINNWPNAGMNTVRFKPGNSCGFGPESTINVTVSASPAVPSIITGDAEICINSVKAYSIVNEPGVTYTWDAGANSTITGTGNSRSIAWSTTGSKTITVTPANACGSGTARTLVVSAIGVPAQPSAITGTATPTIGSSVAYSVTNVTGVNYAWSLSDKGSLSSTGNSSSVIWNTAGSATLSVTPSNACGNGTARTLAVTVNKVPQAITFTLTSPLLANAEVILNGTSDSGLPVSYTSSNTSVAEIIGGNLFIKGSGSINITASQAGDNVYAPATNVVVPLTINKDNQTITFASLTSQTFDNGSFVLEATTTSELPITFVSSNTSVVTISGNIATIVGAGNTNITASQGGNAIYNAATPIVRALTVNKADQTIMFEPIVAKSISDPPFPLTAIATSGLAVSYTSSNPAVATVSGSTVTIVGQGTTTITASQAGNVNYSAATNVPQILTVNSKQSQTIIFSALAAKTFGDPNFNLSATTSSGLAISYSSSNTAVATISGNTVTIVGAGTANITASQAGDAIYNPAVDVMQQLIVNKANQTITFGALAARQLSEGSFQLSATASSGLSVSFASSNTSVATISENTVTLVAAGTTTITATQIGNENYNAASAVAQVLTVNNMQAQTITFSTLAAKTFGDANFNLSATASSGLAVSYTSSNASVATISGNTVTIVGAGTTVITASQAGNSQYDPAASVEQTLTVNKANQMITFALPAERGLTQGNLTLAATSTSGLTILYSSSNTSVATASGSTLTLLAAGNTTITATQAGNTNYNAASNVVLSLMIIDDRQTIALTGDLNFGNVLLGETTTRTMTITNRGNAVLQISAITLPQGFSSAVGATTVNANASITTQITFAPTELKSYTGSAVINSDAISGNSSLTLSGTGVTITGFNEPGMPAGELDVYPNPGTGAYMVKIKMAMNKTVVVTDFSGRARYRILKSTDEQHHQLDLLDLPEGIYYLKIEEQGSVAVKRIVKLN